MLTIKKKELLCFLGSVSQALFLKILFEEGKKPFFGIFPPSAPPRLQRSITQIAHKTLYRKVRAKVRKTATPSCGFNKFLSV